MQRFFRFLAAANEAAGEHPTCPAHSASHHQRIDREIEIEVERAFPVPRSIEGHHFDCEIIPRDDGSERMVQR